MALVRYPALLSAVFNVALRRADQAPTTLLQADTTMYRSFDQKYFTVDTYRHILRRDQAMNALRIPKDTDENRFTGSSHNSLIPLSGGLYCSLQSQAIVNENAYYVEEKRKKQAVAAGNAAPNPLPRSVVLNSKAVIRIRTLGPFLAADVSPHNPSGMHFVNSLRADPAVQSAMKSAGIPSKPLWDAMNDGIDCSVARGIGLAFAQHGYEALCAQTVRTSERSALELGDNLIFFGPENKVVQNLSAVEAYLFPPVGPPEVYPVEF